MATTTSTINHGDIHHQSTTMTLHQLNSLAQLTKSEGKVLSYAVSSDSTEDLIFFHTQGNPVMDFLLEGENGSSRESLANLLDEGLGTSLDGTDEISSSIIHPSLGRNDSGVFSSDETTGGNGIPLHQIVTSSSSNCSTSTMSPSISTSNSPVTQTNTMTSTTTSSTIPDSLIHKKHRPKNTSPNRQGPQRCAICGKTFSNASALTKHKLTHSDERKHSCTVCGKAFKRQDHLNGHMLTHRSKKPFECSAKGCGKSYCDARSLRRHIESRHGQEALATMTIAPTPQSPAQIAADALLNNNINNNNNNSSKKNLNVSSTSNNPLLCQGSSSPSISASGCGGSGSIDNGVTELLSVDTGDQSGVSEVGGNCTSLLSLSDCSGENLLETSFETAMEMDVIDEEEMNGNNEDSDNSEGISFTSTISSGSDIMGSVFIKKEISTCSSTNNNNNNNVNFNNNLISSCGNNININNNNSLLVDLKPVIVNGVVVPHSSVHHHQHPQQNHQQLMKMSRSQSQLHQLLTQRALNANSNSASALTMATLLNNVTLASKLCSSEDGNGTATTNNNKYQQNSWPNNETESGKGGGCLLSPSSSSSVFGLKDSSLNSIVIKCPTSPTGGPCSPSSLKEQLELIHQIIQQTQEESAIPPNNNNNNISNSKLPKSTLKKAKCFSIASSSEGESSLVETLVPSSEEAGTNVNTNTTSVTLATTTATSLVSTTTSTSGKPGNEDKPVECTICCRRFKNTPALNGHMRLHGGYFKKDSDGKKKEHSSKESNGIPLQTASVSVRALIEEKIIQRRNTIINTQAAGLNVASTDKNATVSSISSTSNSNQIASTNAAASSNKTCGGSSLGPTTLSTSGNCSSPVAAAVAQQHPATSSSSSGVVAVGVEVSSNSVGSTVEIQQNSCESQSCGDNINSSVTFTTSSPSESTSFPFEYPEDNTDYLLIEEEVFNKVSSICPDSFFCGIEESILSGVSVEGSDSCEQLPAECWSWATTNSVSGVDALNSRLNSLFSSSDGPSTPNPTTTTTSSTSSTTGDHFGKADASNGETPFTPIPSSSLDSVFYTSPATQSPQQQDSPSCIYPTPPASLESHNALQSPLFPFPTVFPFENGSAALITTANPATSTNIIMSTGICSSGGGSNTISSSINNTSLISTNVNSNGGVTGVRLSVPSFNSISPMMLLTGNNNNLIMASNSSSSLGGSITGGNVTTTSAGGINVNNIVGGMKPVIVRGVTKGRNSSGGSDLNMLTPSPSNSPSLSLLGSSEDSVQSIKELKVNEPSRMDSSSTVEEDILFRSPNRIYSSSNSSSLMKVTKRKQVRNTLASNLRPQSSNCSSHFTPYPILSPVRSAPGLYWTFSTKLSHVDESKKEKPRINVGANFQASIPSLNVDNKRRKLCSNYQSKEVEDMLWQPHIMDLCSPEEVDKYLEFACCSAIPGGGRNKEYALHILSLCNGDINAAMLLLMNPDPKLPIYLRRYKYPEREKWSRREINSFQEALLRHGKDFSQVAKEIGSKSADGCVMFYQLWKKVCPNEYQRVRNLWKKREAAFTIELLKNIPPPAIRTFSIDLEVNSNSTIVDNIKKEKPISKLSKPQASPVGSRGLGINEEFPCKVCGKVFSKVKSRSAHMKSHRPPDSYDNNNQKKNSKSGISQQAKLQIQIQPSAASSPPPAFSLSSSSPLQQQSASILGNFNSSEEGFSLSPHTPPIEKTSMMLQRNNSINTITTNITKDT